MLDCNFDHQKQYETCAKFIIDTFNMLDNQDFFGLIFNSASTEVNEDLNLDIILEEKVKHQFFKHKILKTIFSYENSNARR